jgi:hypothetical protein
MMILKIIITNIYKKLINYNLIIKNLKTILKLIKIFLLKLNKLLNKLINIKVINKIYVNLEILIII